jgi:hypothetical protein
VNLVWLLGVALTASDGEVPFVWDAPPECPPQAQVEAQVQRLLDEQPERAADRWAVARARREGDGWSLRVFITDGEQMWERNVTSASCEEAARAAAVIASMALQPEPEGTEPLPFDETPADIDALLEQSEPEPEPETKPAEPTGPEGPDPLAEPIPAEPVRPIAALRLDGLPGVGALPTVDGGIGLSPAVVWPRARLELRLAWFAPRLTSFGEEDRAAFQLVTVAARGCGVPGKGRVEIPMCGGLETGAMMGRAQGFRFLHGSTRPWLAVVTSVSVVFRVRRNFALWLGVEPWIAAVRPPHIALDGEVHRSSIAGFRGVVGLEVRFESPGVRR